MMMAKTWSVAASAALTLLGAGFASADVKPLMNVEEFNSIAEEAEGFPHQKFRSSDIVAPILQINSWDRAKTDDAPYIFIGSVYGHMKGGPMILDASDLSLVYADQQYENAYTSSVQTINGTNYMMFWQGYHTRGHANGWCLVYDENYNMVYNVTAQGLHGALADMHEMKMTEDHTIIFTTYFNIPYDCTAKGGPADALLMDSGFQEVDATTNEVLFDWHASKWFNIADSWARYEGGYGVGPDSGFDAYHINSVEKTASGNYLVSSRHLCSVILVDGTDGHPIWVLGGHQNQFKDISDGKATNFGWQHDARFFKDESHITMFDNHGEQTGSCNEEKGCKTRGLQVKIDATAMTVEVVKEYWHPEKMNAGAMGGFQPLESGNVMVAWGHTPGFVEYTYDGTPVMDVQRGKIGGKTQNDMFAYRVEKHEWVGRPRWPPAIAMDAPHGTTENATIYLSWNGATDIATWALLASDTAMEVRNPKNLIAHVNRTGFETTVELGSNTTARYLGAAAVDADGNILGSTYVFDMWSHQPIYMASEIESLELEENPKSNKDHYKSAGMGGGGVLVIVAVAGGIFYLWRRRRSSRADVEEARYKRVDTDE